MKRYFKRPWLNQCWCVRKDGQILLIHYKEPGEEYRYHYNGDAHIFMTAKDTFNQDGGIEITRDEWLNIRKQHIERLREF